MASRYAQSWDGASGIVKYEHVVIAERALGKPLPDGAQVHHVDQNPRNNAPSNLVICQDAAYHKLLHQRAVIVRAGGNPNTHNICRRCCRLVPLEGFSMSRANDSYGRASRCRACCAEVFGAWADMNRDERLRRARARWALNKDARNAKARTIWAAKHPGSVPRGPRGF